MLGMEKRFGMGPLFPSLSAVLPVSGDERDS